jgi:hypothetical protein
VKVKSPDGQAWHRASFFAQDRTAILDAMNQAVSRLYAYELAENGTKPAA